MGRFSGKRILITGGTSGMGLAGARRIVAEGGQVIVTGMSKEHLDETKQALPGALILRNDAGDPVAADALAEKVRELGSLDGLWLNAGYAAVAAIEDIDAAFFDRMMNANVRGPVLQLAKLSSYLNKGSSVVLTSSTATYEGAPIASTYAATKGAMIAMARSWASALGERQIRVNVVVPGPIETNFRNFMADDFRRKFEADVVGHLALARVGTAEEAAAVALFLLSDDASYVTGSQYAVDGGLIMQ
ncbi:SDR family oxidoreductase [Phyllobacterium sp. OV277]|uniref:SDR family oxidoreductase n=1 Tax=Phyllobacterium sp. OV277 TaxID=1882772 RepID=UPI00088F49E1|nr:SDR family oxidoreductase [Phyllobacterium sp. OV277]SDO52582.1 NAD(P)-dependent dehydrogenase, short-chain alcohol dehydrogenase family [Phyllobacterium sp. OV277]